MRRKISVLTIEDSALMRRSLRNIINSDPELYVIGAAKDGAEGLAMAKRLNPDVVTVDINLPDMDGLTCLQHIMITTPRPCLMISAYTKKDSLETFEALELGAIDFVEKPSGEISRDIEKKSQEIINKIKAIARTNLSSITLRLPAKPVQIKPKLVSIGKQGNEAPDKVVVIGVSTGGPRTLMDIIPVLPPNLRAPVILIQHMPKRFTGSFAERLDSHSQLNVKEAENGETLRDGVVYVAPGDSNLLVRKSLLDVFIALSRPGKDDIYVPSVEKSLDSAIDTFRDRTIGVILTGMGNDGVNAMERLQLLGGQTIAESKTSAIIYGMPEAVISRGAARIIEPSNRIANSIVEAVNYVDNPY